MIDWAIVKFKDIKIDKTKRRFFAKYIPKNEIPSLNGLKPFNEDLSNWGHYSKH
jgi:hypothetical protein